MAVIIFEGVLFVALVATCGALFFMLVANHTTLGTRLKQTRNRRRIDRVSDQICPTHGIHAEHELVRLPSGEVMCPECYKETMYDQFNE
jgi:hypothetical protein